MLGSGMGTLRVLVDGQVLFQRSGDQGGSWKDASIALPPNAARPLVEFVA